MPQPIKGGAISNLLGIIDSIFKSVFQDMEDAGFKNSDYKEVKNDAGNVTGFSFSTLTEMNHELHIKALQSAGQSSLYDFYIVGDNNKKKKYLHKPKDELQDCVVAFLEEFYDDPDTVDDFEVAEDDEAARNIDVQDGFNSAEACRKIQISLSRIEANDEICYGPIFCNYSEYEVYEDLESVLEDDDFVASLTEEPQNYEIIPSEEAFDIQVVDQIQPMDCISAVIKAQFTTLAQLYACISLGDRDCDSLECAYADNLNPMSCIERLRWQVDFMLNRNVSDNPINMRSILSSITLEDTECCQSVQDIIENYCLVLDIYYPNFPHELQAVLDEWLLTFRYSYR